jgi:hypothetical protein
MFIIVPKNMELSPSKGPATTENEIHIKGKNFGTQGTYLLKGELNEYSFYSQ